jgi:hypothetical protein
MGTRSRRQRRRLIGGYKITKSGNRRVLTLSSKLEGTPFPTEFGTEVNVELVEKRDEDPHLEIWPTNDE